jgi:hypothetical protein
MQISQFGAIAPFLTNPFTLAGLALFLFFGVIFLFRTRKPTGANASSVIRYGFILAAVSVLAGFGSEAIRLFSSTSNSSVEQETRGDESPIITQETRGDQSPAISGTKGNVTITNEPEQD